MEPTILERWATLGLGQKTDPDDRIRIAPGTARNCAHLARFHYRAGPPATCVRVLAAHDAGAGRDGPAVGVLVVSMPVLNGPWRDRLWPHVFADPNPRRRAARVNAEIRCISRVIVDPRYRALGIARRLVEAYLRDPLTKRTEAVAAMGAVCPFFERAGMRPVSVPLAERDRRLAQVLRHEGIRPWGLVEVSKARRTLAESPRLVHALRVWARVSKQTRAWADAPEGDLWALAVQAGGALCARPLAYGYDAT